MEVGLRLGPIQSAFKTIPLISDVFTIKLGLQGKRDLFAIEVLPVLPSFWPFTVPSMILFIIKPKPILLNLFNFRSFLTFSYLPANELIFKLEVTVMS